MTRDQIKRILKEQKPLLFEKYHVSKIGVFGSVARNEQTEVSDIDILVEFSKPVGFEFFDLQDYLQTLFDKPVDLVTVNALKPQIKEEILSEVQFQ